MPLVWIVEEEEPESPDRRFFVWFPNDGTAYFKTVDEAKEWCSNRGYRYRIESA